MSLRQKCLGKLSPRYYSLFQILPMVGNVSYKLHLPLESRLHFTFHVSCLMQRLGQHMVPLPSLPPMDFEGIIRLEHVVVLQERSHQLMHRTITQILIQWQVEGTENATWENLYHLQQKFPHLTGKVF